MWNLAKYFRNFGGLNFSIPELLRDSTYATDLLNVRLSENLSLSKRRGYQYKQNVGPIIGSVTFNETAIATGTQTIGRFVMNEDLNELSEGSIEITYSGLLQTPSISIGVSGQDNKFKFIFSSLGVPVETIDLGTGLEGAPVTIDDLINSVTTPGLTISLTSGSNTVPAAFLDITQETTLDPSTDVGFRYLRTVPVPTSMGSTKPFQGHFDARNSPKWQPQSTIQAHDVLYITSQEDGLWKYDGELLFKAGLPKPIKPVVTATAGSNSWRYITQYQYTDAKENIIHSEISEETIVESADVPTTVTVDVSNVIGKGFDDERGPVGDKNLKISLYRTTNEGTIFRLVETKSIDEESSGSISFTDNLSDVDLTDKIEFVLPVFPATIAPNCRYIDVWRNQLVLTGDPAKVNTVYVADIESIEGFPVLNSFPTSSRLGTTNTGIKSLDNHLFVFKAMSVSIVTGDLTAGTGDIQIDTITDEGIGALSHHSIIEYNGALYFISQNGIYSISNSGLKHISEGMEPLFFNYSFTEERTQSFYWIKDRKLLFLLPQRNGSGLNKQTSRVLVYDIFTSSWTLWNNIDWSVGIHLDEDEVWMAGDELVSNFLNLRSSSDYADHAEPIRFIYKTHWETAGEPSVPKKFNRIKVYTIDSEFQTFESTNFRLKIQTNHNFQDLARSDFVIDFGGDYQGWGFFSWGDTPWGEVKSIVKASRLQAQRAQSLRVVFSNENLHENVLISGFELEVSNMFSPAIKDK